MVGSIEGGEGRGKGFDGEVAFTGARAGGGDVLGILGKERAKGREELVEEILVVPLRARDWALGLCVGLSTAAARWQPQNLVGVAWPGVKGSSARGRAVGSFGTTHGS